MLANGLLRNGCGSNGGGDNGQDDEAEDQQRDAPLPKGEFMTEEPVKPQTQANTARSARLPTEV